jgi:hypothetical protein
MDYDNDNCKETQVHTLSSVVSVVRQRSRGASTPSRHRHTSPATLGNLPAPPLHPREKDEQPEDLAGLRISHAFRGFAIKPDIVFDEPFTVPSEPFFRKIHDPAPVYSSPVITAGDTGSPASMSLVASEHLGLLSCQPPNVMRSISDESTSSSHSAGSDPGHNGLIPSIGTTNKFTHKWPTPKSLNHELQPKKLKDVRSTALRPSQSPVSALEDGQGLGSSRAHWTVFKWCLLISATTVFAYGMAGLIFSLTTWFKGQSTSRSYSPYSLISNECSSAWDQADVMAVADGDLLILITWAASMLLLTALLGMTGTLLNSRPILAIYAILLWPAFISLLSVGYVAYKRGTFSLDHKLSLSWSRHYNPLDRLRIQDALHCCGFYSSLHAASPSRRCYLRAPLPGCKRNLYDFEHQNLLKIWRTAFALVPLHMVNLVVALLCANHMTNTFGKGITPKQYRLSAADVKADAEKFLDNVTPFFRPNASKVSPVGFFKGEKEGLVRSI